MGAPGQAPRVREPARRGPRPRRRARRPLSLRPLLAALALGVLALPIAITLVVGAFIRGSVEQGPILRFVQATRELEAAVGPDASGALAAKPGYRSPVWLELLVVDSAGKVVFSTLPAARPGDRAEPGLAAAFAARAVGRPFYSDRVERDGKPLGAWYAIVPTRGIRTELEAWQPLLSAAFFGFLAFVAFGAGIVVAARLGGAVERLQRAAGRIASGDLESPVSLRGVREIEELAAAMDSMRSSLREDLARRSRFLAAISHDLRTPLTSIIGYLEAVEDGLAEDPGTLGRYLDIIRGKAGLLQGRIDGLIDFARMETYEWRLSFQALELQPFLEELARVGREDALMLGKSLEADLRGAAGILAPADRALLRRALENILANALRYGPPGQAISFVVRKAEAGLELFVEDKGPGLAPGEEERVFEPFYRGPGEQGGEGLGLGLYIARSILRGHGWEIAAGSAPGGGARFTVRIPSA